jgi:hypothetical protein
VVARYPKCGARLAASGFDEVRLTGVHGQDDFVVFLAPDHDAVVAPSASTARLPVGSSRDPFQSYLTRTGFV